MNAKKVHVGDAEVVINGKRVSASINVSVSEGKIVVEVAEKDKVLAEVRFRPPTIKEMNDAFFLVEPLVRGQ